MKSLYDFISKEETQSSRNLNNIINTSYYAVIALTAFMIIIRYAFTFVWEHNMSNEQYWIEIILISGAIMLLIIKAVELFIKLKRVPNIVKETLSILLVVILCSIGIYVHSISHNVLTLYMIPVFVSTIFAKRWLTFTAYLVSMIGLSINTWFISQNGYLLHEESILMEATLAAIIISLAYTLSHVLILPGRTNLLISLNKESLEEEVLLDPLTELFNKKTLDLYFKTLLDTAKEKRVDFSYALIDFDDFHRINEMFGDPVGDKYLKKAAKLLKDLLPDYTAAFRIGGDEITILFGGYNAAEAKVILEKFQTKLSQLKIVGSKEHRLTASIGIAQIDLEVNQRSDLFHAANKALIHAKRIGKNQIITSDLDMYEIELNNESLNRMLNHIPIMDSVENINRKKKAMTKILVSIIHEDVIFTQTICSRLKSIYSEDYDLGFQTFPDGQAFLESDWFMTDYPHIIVMEDIMSRKTGLEVLYQIRKLPQNNNYKVFMLTRRNSVEDKIEAYQNGADYYLTLPLNMQLFTAKFKRELERTSR